MVADFAWICARGMVTLVRISAETDFIVFLLRSRNVNSTTTTLSYHKCRAKQGDNISTRHVSVVSI